MINWHAFLVLCIFPTLSTHFGMYDQTGVHAIVADHACMFLVLICVWYPAMMAKRLARKASCLLETPTTELES